MKPRQRKLGKTDQPLPIQQLLNGAHRIVKGMYIFSNLWPDMEQQEEAITRALLDSSGNIKKPQIGTRLQNDDEYLKALQDLVRSLLSYGNYDMNVLISNLQVLDSTTHTRGEIRRKVGVEMIESLYGLSEIRNLDERQSVAKKLSVGLYYVHPIGNVR